MSREKVPCDTINDIYKIDPGKTGRADRYEVYRQRRPGIGYKIETIGFLDGLAEIDLLYIALDRLKTGIDENSEAIYHLEKVLELMP